jgi:hypothetical protein
LLAQKDKAVAALVRLERGFVDNIAYAIAEVHALRGEADLAFQWLYRAYQQREMPLIFDGGVIADPNLNSLRGDRRYKVFPRQLKLPE